MKSFYSLISYDWKYLLESIQSYYMIADEIILGIDESNLTWKKNEFKIENEFYDKLNVIDKDKKCKIIKDNFHLYDNPMQNETYERNVLSSYCNGRFIIAVDSDEIFLNVIEFDNWLKNKDNTFDLDFLCTWKTVYKKIGDELLICVPHETALLGTCHKNSYIKARHTGFKTVMSPLIVLHFSWGRTEDEIKTKMKNWGHADDFNSNEHLNIWKNVTLENYDKLKYFHPLKLKSWWQGLEKL